MKLFNNLPKSVKKTIRYIYQDVKSIEKLEQIEKELVTHIEKRKEQLKKDN
ncbi:LytR family transcriptional regulator [Gracilibacillus thailandensis]|uniref:LytR family transcriptional regulator n=1 Tax=Gracilibacillus thailandensis TaxID=563735 RepID=A0A6N7R169_9BACI|nr:LytR family transcriptional regulator [Gracilibacillus thailandensis]MRI67362.1 LytR family transcriptional regulator [Gracilibacillus thailandensis]